MGDKVHIYRDIYGNVYHLYIKFIEKNSQFDTYISFISLTINGNIVFGSFQSYDRVINIFESEYYNYGDDLNNVSVIIIDKNSIKFDIITNKQTELSGDDFISFKNWLIEKITPISVKREYKLNKLLKKINV